MSTRYRVEPTSKYETCAKNNPRHFVYLHRDAKGVALYCGVTNDMGQRQKRHRSASVWWPESADILVTEFKSRLDAEKHEAFLIAETRPVHNKKRRCIGAHPELMSGAELLSSKSFQGKAA